jgi:hypothetical protein
MSTPKLYVAVVHTLPERTRLRLHPTPLAQDAAQAVAARLAATPGVREVTVDRLTGSVCCRHQHAGDAMATAGALAAIAAEALPAAVVLAAGQRPPRTAPSWDRSKVAHAVAQAFGKVNRELLASTDGALDLGTIAALGFAGAGAAEVVVKGNLPAPPWFNLAWWAFRTFMTFETKQPPAAQDGPAERGAPG